MVLKNAFHAVTVLKVSITFLFLLPLKILFFALLPLYKSFANYAVLGQGLYIQSKCTKKKDTICDVLYGYYCIEEDSNSQCRYAVKHSVCKPGQETKTLGIASQCLKTNLISPTSFSLNHLTF